MTTVETHLTPERIAEIKAYCAKATAGLWIDDQCRVIINNGLTACICVCYFGHIENAEQQHNAQFIANAHTDLPAAIAEIERLRDANLLEYNGRLQDGREQRDEIKRLRELLKKAHDAMHSWHSSEYADHPLSMEVSKGLQ